MIEPLLLCCDLDRTVLPNGPQPESPAARPAFRELAKTRELRLVYVTGRSERLLDEAIEQWQIPLPTLAVGDVGTTIFERDGPTWRTMQRWWDEIAPAWRGLEAADLAERLGKISGLELQEPERQNRFKLSYYAPSNLDAESLCHDISGQLGAMNVRASVIWSVDETNDIGLVDVLPESATKLHAVRFVGNHLGIDESRTVFAGDSGNDLPALTSGLNAVLVANATPQVRHQAINAVTARGFRDRLYVAKGAFGLNGNYVAGVLEGLAHFLPETEPSIENALRAARA